MKKKLLSIIMATVMAAVVLSGCGKKDTVEPKEETAAVESSAEASSEAGAEGTSVAEALGKPATDRSGNEVKIPDEINGIISMAPSTTQILIDLGLGDKIIACDTYSYQSYADSLKKDIPQFDMMTPDQEQIIALGADVVFTTGMSASHGEDVFASVKEAGVCVSDTPSSASIDDIKKDIEFFGQATGKSSEATAIVDSMQASIDEIKEIASKIPEDEKKTVLFELFTPTGDVPSIYTAGSNTYINEMLDIVGAVNVAGKEKEQWPALTEEAAIGMNPQVILTADMYTDDVINVLLSMSGWENVTAIKDKAVYQIDNDTVNRPNQHVISAMIEMGKDIYPDYYKDVVDPFASDAADAADKNASTDAATEASTEEVSEEKPAA